MSIKVILADDHRIVREGLVLLLREARGIIVAAEADNAAEAVEKALSLAPDVVVMDLTMPGMSGVEATRRIVGANPAIKVLVLSMVLDKNCLLECLEAGAKGYLIKNCAAEELVTAIRILAGGKPYFCAEATELIISGLTQQPSDNDLSPRELDVLKLIGKGASTKEIAHSLGLSNKTIETCRVQIKKKLNLNSIADLIKYAIREGICSVD